MVDMTIKSPNMNNALQEMNKLAAQASNQKVETKSAVEDDFYSMFEQALNKVNDIQASASAAKEAYETGDADIVDVMLKSQKANLSFQSLLQVRNKFINAYREIMNMQV